MRTLALSIVLLLCVSVAQAGYGYSYTYNFDNLTPWLPVNMQVDGDITWDSVNKTNQNVIQVRDDPNGGKYAVCNATNGEQLISTLTNYDPNAVGSVFGNLESTDTQIRLTWTGAINRYAGFMVGIWMDGQDMYPNTATTNELEHVVQFGTDYVYQSWRVRGANGIPNDARDTTGMPTGAVPTWVKLTLDIDLDANYGDGGMSLSIEELDSGTVTLPPLLQNVPMSLLSYDPTHSTYGNPAMWTGWYIRNARLGGGDDPNVTLGYHIIKEMTLEVIPEPATLSLLALGGLVALRRRRR